MSSSEKTESELTVYHCPQCGDENEKCGEVSDHAGLVSHVFQCDSCSSSVRFGDSRFDVAFTYTVSPDGSVSFSTNAV